MGKKLLTRLGAVAAGGVLALAASSAALAQPPTGFNQEDDLPIAADGEFEHCDDRFADLPDDIDGWHFVVPSNGSFESITVVFQTDPEDETQTQAFTGSPGDPGEFVFHPDESHAEIRTPGGWLLVEVSADFTGHDFFNLSNTCPGQPGEDNGNGDENGNGDNGDENGNGDNGDENGAGNGAADDELPLTGAPVWTLVGLGALLLAVGGGTVGFLAVRRRRNLTNLLEG